MAPSSAEQAAALILPSLRNDTQEMSARFEMVLDATTRGSDNFVIGGELAGLSRVGIEEAMTFLMTDGQQIPQADAAAQARNLAANFCVGNAQYCADEELTDQLIHAGGDLLGLFALGTAIAVETRVHAPRPLQTSRGPMFEPVPLNPTVRQSATNALRLADRAIGSTPRSQLSPQLRSVHSWRSQIVEHQAKLEAFRRNPWAVDNQGRLANNVARPNVMNNIYQRRIRHLEREIKAFSDDIVATLGQGG